MACPVKYRALGDFHEYYSGVRKAPIMTVFVGGNHEASSYLWELFYGGWVAPNIYYLGAASVLNYRGLRIGGLSGIYNSKDYARPHTERLPYFPGDIRTIYHVRQYDVFKLYQVTGSVDVMVSHDWPAGIEHHGNLDELLRYKPFFRSDIEKGELGSPPARSLLMKLRPRYWFSAHLHVKFSAVVDHHKELQTNTGPGVTGKGKGREGSPVLEKNPDELDLDLDEGAGMKPVNEDEIDLGHDNSQETTALAENSDEIDLDMGDDPKETLGVSNKSTDEIELDLDSISEDISSIPREGPSKSTDETQPDLNAEVSSAVTTPPLTGAQEQSRYTHFLALDKCLPKRDFLQILSIPLPSTSDAFSYDPEWLAVTRALNPYLNSQPSVLASEEFQASLPARIAEERKWVEENIVAKGKLLVPDNFATTAPIHTGNPKAYEDRLPESFVNPQTTAFCELVGIENGTLVGGGAAKEKVYEEWKAKGGGDHKYTRRGGGRGGRGGGRGWRGGRGRGRAMA